MSELLGYISSTSILGVFPLDSILHFVIGALITIYCLKFKIKFIYGAVIILIVGLTKEVYDSSTIGSTMNEHFIDMFATFLYPFLLGVVRLIKNRRLN